MKHILTLTLAAAAFVLASPQAFSSNDDIKKMTVFVNKKEFKKDNFRAVLKIDLKGSRVQLHTCEAGRKKSWKLRKIRLEHCLIIGTHSNREESDLREYLPSKIGKALFGFSLKRGLTIVSHKDISSKVYSRKAFNAGDATYELYKAYYQYRRDQDIND